MNSWKAIGITLLVLFALGLFDTTRKFAIGLAVFIAIAILLAGINKGV